MALAAGSRLGPYEIAALIGTGGMGEVYRAVDTNLGRHVAIKVLLDEFANDAERLARFSREARTLASLNHPNIAIVHGFETAGNIRALVMELVDGPTLSDRIARGPIPVDESLAIAKQIAEALEAAHDVGIVHRDLKPSNIKVRPDGTVKVLDFGLAKMIGQPEGSRDDSNRRQPDHSTSPTITTPAMTLAGVILGTAAYMSPEQAKGRSADTRSDIWAFGCVLYEMLTGKRAFEGEDVADTLAAVLRSDPDWTALPADVPAPVRTLVHACLTKDHRRRIGDVSTALFIIDRHAEWIATRSTATPSALAVTRVPIWRKALSIAALVTVALVAGYGAWTLKPSTPGHVTRFAIPLAPGDTLTGLVALSPDSRWLAYAVNNRLYLRSFEQVDPVQIGNSDTPPLASARTPFFSPDSQWLGFWEAGQLKKVSVNGGAVINLSAVSPPPQGVTWAADNTIWYGHSVDGIWRVSGDGGSAQRIIAMQAGQRAHRPEPLPDGRSVLFTLAETPIWDEAQIVVQSIDGTSRKTLMQGSDARYLSTGHLLYVFGNTVFGVRFDPSSGTVRGAPVPLVEGVWRPAVFGPYAFFAPSVAGTMAYAAAVNELPRRTLVWVDRDGREEAIPAPTRTYRHPRLSPDGSRIALVFPDDRQNTDIWVWDIGRQTWARLTSDPAPDGEPTWTPDGQRLLFTSRRSGEISLFSQPATGTGNAELVMELNRQNSALPAISPDGKYMLLRYAESGSSYVSLLDLAATESGAHAAPLGGVASGGASHPVREPRPLVKTEFEEYNAEISPDGRWVAYQSNSSGTFEVYVQPFPEVTQGLWPVSINGGTEPVWGRDGRELFYRSLDGAMMRVAIAPEPVWKTSTPTRLFDGSAYARPTSILGAGLARMYDLSPDGQRFLMLKNVDPPAQPSPAPRIVIVQNWLEELKQRIPTR